MTSIQLGTKIILRNYKRKLSLIKRQFLLRYSNFYIYFVISICFLTIFTIWTILYFITPSLRGFLYGSDVKIDWHDWKLIDEDEYRTGLGEHGEPAYLSHYPHSSKHINDTHGFNGYLSDRIALNRSLPDNRPPEYVQCNINKQFGIEIKFSV